MYALAHRAGAALALSSVARAHCAPARNRKRDRGRRVWRGPPRHEGSGHERSAADARWHRPGAGHAKASLRSRRQVESSRNETDASALDRLRFPRAPRLLQFSQKPHLTDLKHAARGRRSRHNRVRDGRAPITCLRRIRRPLALASTIASRRPGAMTAMAASRKKCNTSVAHLVHCLCPLLRSS